MELLERSSVEAVLCCCRTGRPAVSLLPHTASAATHGVTNAHGIFFCGVEKQQQQTLHTRSRTPASSQSAAASCVLQQGIPTENTTGGRLMVADHSAWEENCSFMRCRCHRSSLHPSSRFARSISRSPSSSPSSSCPSALYDDSSSSPRSSKSGPPHVRFPFSMSVPPLLAPRLEKAQHALSQDGGIQSSSSAGCSLSTSPHLRSPPASDADTNLSDGTRRAVPFTIPSTETTRLVGPLGHVIGRSVVGARTGRSAAVDGRLRKYLLHISDHVPFSCPSNSTWWLANRFESLLKPFLRELQQRHQPRERAQSWQQQQKYTLERRQRQQRPWEQHHWEQQQQRRWYTPPSRRNWSKQHSKIFTRRPLTDNFALGRLHPELEWFRERASQPVSLFMGFPDLEKIHVRGGASYINEMDAATLSIVLAAMGSQGRTSVASPAHLPQHNSPLIDQLGMRAAALAATAPDPTLAYLFRGCAAAGVSDWATVCTLVGTYERLEDLSVHHISKVLYAATAARLYPRGPLMEDLFKTSLEHLGSCTPADISRLFYAILHAGEPRPSADPILLQARERIQQAMDVSLEMCSSSTLVRVHSATARALRSSALTLTTPALHAAPPSQHVPPASSDTFVRMGLLAQKAAVILSARLFRARPGDLATFLVGLRTIETDNGDVAAETIVEILDRRLQVLEPQQLASLLAVLADPPQQHRVRWRESTSRLLTFLKMSLEERRQQWQPETCLQILLTISRLREEWKGLIRPVVAAVCDRLVSTGGLHTYIGRKDPTEQGLGDGRQASPDKFSGSLAAISKQGMPSDELSMFPYQMSPLHMLGIGDHKQLLHALQELQVRHKQLQEVVTHVVTMKRYDFKNKRHIQVATTVRAW